MLYQGGGVMRRVVASVAHAAGAGSHRQNTKGVSVFAWPAPSETPVATPYSVAL